MGRYSEGIEVAVVNQFGTPQGGSPVWLMPGDSLAIDDADSRAGRQGTPVVVIRETDRRITLRLFVREPHAMPLTTDRRGPETLEAATPEHAAGDGARTPGALALVHAARVALRRLGYTAENESDAAAVTMVLVDPTIARAVVRRARGHLPALLGTEDGDTLRVALDRIATFHGETSAEAWR